LHTVFSLINVFGLVENIKNFADFIISMKKYPVSRIDKLLQKIDIPSQYKNLGSVYLIKKTRQAGRLI